MRFCGYKNALGVPGEKFHTHVAGIAIFDVLGTAAIAWAISAAFHWSMWIVFVVLFILATFLHWLFCVDTTVVKMLGLGS